MDIPAIIKRLFNGENPSNTLWNLAYGLIFLGVVLLGYGLFMALFSSDTSLWLIWPPSIFGAALVFGGFAMIEAGEVEIPANPPHLGLPTIWGERQPITLHEQDAMTADFWPLKIGVELIPAQAENRDYCFKNVPCKAQRSEPGEDIDRRSVGASVDIEVSVTFFPNPGDKENEESGKYLVKYINHGFAGGVSKIIDDTLGQAVRDTARDFYWEDFTLLKKELTVLLLQQVAILDFRQIPDDSDLLDKDGNLRPDRAKVFTPEDYAELGAPCADLREYLFKQLDASSDAAKRRRQDIELFLHVARANDVADELDLGIKFARLNVTKITAVGEVGKAADEAAAEDKQREREEKDLRTVERLANSLVEAAKNHGQVLPYNEALAIVRSERGKLSEHRFDVTGIPFKEIQSVLEMVMKGKQNG